MVLPNDDDRALPLAGRRLALRAASVLAIAVWLGAAAPAGAPAPRFDLMELRIEGNTVLPERDIEAALYPFLGPGKTVEDAERARAALEELYTKRGYATVAVRFVAPPDAEGVLRLAVVQMPVGRLRVVGAQYVAPSVIKSAAPSLTPGNVPRMDAVQADLLAMNQLPDRTITPAVKPGVQPDTVDVDLKVEDHLPLHATAELNNRRSAQTTALRSVGSLSYTNLWQRGDSVSLGFQTAPMRMRDAKVATAGYTYRIPDSRASLLASYLQSDSNVSTGAAGTVIGRGKTAGLRLLLPLDGSDGFTHALSAGFDYKSYTQQIGLSGQFSRTPLTYVPFTASYNAGWTGPSSTTDAAATLVWAFGHVGSSVEEFEANRANARPNFAYLKADFDHTHTLPYQIEIYAHGQVQVSPTPLVSSEQLSLGGMDTVRGYLEGEWLGDYGGAGQLELRSPPLARHIGGPVTSLRFLAFADAGAAQLRRTPSEQTTSSTLASVGVGASVRLFDRIGGEIDDAQVLLHGPTTRTGANRVLFRLYGEF